MKSYLFGGECCSLGMTKNNKKMGFFSLLQPNQTLRQKEKWYTCVSFVHQFVWGHEKKAFFLHVWLSKVLLLEITLNKTKNNFKKNFFFLVWTAKQCQQTKKKLLGLSLPLFQNKSRNNRSPALTFVFSNKQPKSCFVYKWETFFFFVFFIYQKTKLPTDKLFFFCKQNHFEMRNRNQAKKKLNWSFCFLVDSSCLLPPQAKQNNALLQKWGDNSEDNTIALFEVWKTFLSLHCWFFWAKTVWN